jgi:dGTPase
MELADDISYGVHDLEDVLSLQLVTFRQWEDEIIKKLPPKSEDAVSKEVDFYNEKLFSGSNKDRKHAISKLIGYFIPNIKIIEKNDFGTPLLKYEYTDDSFFFEK